MTGARPRRGAGFALLLPLLLAAQPVATDSYLPALPAIARDLGSATGSLTFFVLAFGIAQLAFGPLADRIGRRPVLLGGLALYVVAAVGGAFAAGVAALGAWRALQGLAMAAILVCSRAAVRDLYPAHEGPQVMARGLTGLGAVALAAPVLGAQIVQAVGWRAVLLAMALYAAALLALCWRRFDETRAPRVDGEAVRRGSAREVFASPAFRAWASLAAATFGGLFMFLLLSPMVYIGHLGLSPAMYGWIPAGGALIYILGTLGCRRLLHRHGARWAVRFASLLSLGGAAIQALGCWLLAGSAWPLLLGHAFYAFAHGIHQPCGQAGSVGELPHLAGRAVAWSGFGMMMVAFCAGQFASSFVDADFSHGAWPMVVPMLLAGATLVAIAFLWLPRLPTPSKESS